MRKLVENKTIKRKKYFLLGIILIIYVLFCEYVYKVDLKNSLDYFSLACLVCAILIGVMIIITYYILFIKEKKSISMLFIPIAIVLGIVYFMFIPEYETPDEMRHMETAYYMSNQILGESEDGNVYMRKCDYDHLYGDDDNNNTFFHKSFNREKYNNYFYNLIFDNGNDNSLIDVGRTPLNAKQYLYFFSGIGILLGRLLGLNSIITFLIGAFLNYLFAVLGIYYAIRKIPICKEMILLISILPITIQQLTSYSYDCMIIVLAFIFISLAMCVLMDNANKIDFFVLLIVSILLIQAKSGAYAQMILLLPLIG